MAKLTQKIHDDYEEFLVEIPMLLEDFQELLKNSRRYKDVQVDFDDATLDRIEAFYLDVLLGKEKINISPARVNRVFIAYVGEALIERAESDQAKWYLNDEAGDPSFGTPVILGWAKREGIAISPVWLRELFIENHEPFLRDMIDYCANKEKFEEDFFKEFD